MRTEVLPWHERWDRLILAGAALFLRLVVVLLSFRRVVPTADGKFYHVVAQRIAQGEGYTWLWEDGTVTYAAHYPVGYPALMSVPYAIFGPSPGSVMVLNAILGALLVWLCHGLCLDALSGRTNAPVARLAAGFVGAGLALSPTLVGYTPALMTEGAVATFLVLAAWFATRAREKGAPTRAWLLRIFGACALSCAVFLRPQSVLFVPFLGFFSMTGKLNRRALGAVLFTFVSLSLVLPWTLRNCAKMEKCVFVSANGGWNLLIGTFPEGRGAWTAIEGERVPIECREVFAEAAKDECFGAAGARRIRENPSAWLTLVPAKWRATLDHTAAAADHLVESGALPPQEKWLIAYPEFASQRCEFLLALLGAWSLGRRTETPRRRAFRALLLGIGVLGFLGGGAAWGFLACVLLCLMAWQELTSVGVLVGVFAVGTTMLIHGAFFGAGRYALPLIPLVAPLAALGVAEALGYFGSRGYFVYESRSEPSAVKV